MVNAQEWLDEKYPKNETCQIKNEGSKVNNFGKEYNIDNFGKTREQIKKLDIRGKNLERELDLSDFKNLEELWCSNNRLTDLNLSGCNKLKKVGFSHNQLVNFDFNNLNQLEEIWCYNNLLTQITYPSSSEKLTHLSIGNNNLSKQDLSILIQFKNLEELWIGNDDKSKIDKGIYNFFIGSLENLKNLNKLKLLDISNTDIDSGVEYLPESLVKVKYEIDKRPTCKLTEIKEQLDLFTNQELQKPWRELGFTSGEFVAWINTGLKFNEHKLVKHLTQQGHQCNSPQIKEIITQESWQDIHQDFTYPVRKDWEEQGFSKEETKHCIELGFKPNDYYKVSKIVREWENEGFDYEQIKKWVEFGAELDDYKFVSWLRKINLERVQDGREEFQNLRSKFYEYGLCQKCQELNEGNPNTGIKWCLSCSSNNKKIDEFIQKHKKLEWIPYEQFENIKHIADGGFGKVYKARWSKGKKETWKIMSPIWEKDWFSHNVVLKSLNNSQGITEEFLQEIANHKLVENKNIVKCYGISQDSASNNYLMVMEYIEGGDLREYLQKNYNNLRFEDKLNKLLSISQGLVSIHNQELVHKDFHSGNILSNEEKQSMASAIEESPEIAKHPKSFLIKGMTIQSAVPFSPKLIRMESWTNNTPHPVCKEKEEIFKPLFSHANKRPNIQEKKTKITPIKISKLPKHTEFIKCYITDLGLCRPASETNNEKVFGVLPYIAPEVLRGRPYTQASDIYSFGIVAYEVLSSLPPYHDLPHEVFLATKICQGLRPNLDNIIAPQLLKDLISQCWNVDPLQRPTVINLNKLLNSWWSCDKNSEFYKQREEAERESLTLVYKKFSKTYQTHPQAIYTSRLMNFKNLPKPQNSKEINEIFYEITDELESLRITDPVKFSEELEKRFNSLKIQEKSPEVFLRESEEVAPIEIKSSELTKELENLSVRTKRQLSLSAETQGENKLVKSGELVIEPMEIDNNQFSQQIDLENLNLGNNQNWTNIHLSFTDELIQKWKEHNFTFEQCRNWINIGFQPTDYNFCAWLRDIKQVDEGWVLNYGNSEQLNQEFFNWWQECNAVTLQNKDREQQQSNIEVPPKNN
ncbi:MAG: serine/threonine-protein kinase [Candidatus Moeniiplasma glomeromycotorum]|nr:serine/threonine-protein kinase [Candidatus Moeniiplasma glomeromycotorum]MCE8167593.1 serine/threonine-protein kinase [Candidatus Moeniiplasma glomeromycotorum]MCE8169057.1 serine/threonine-protein kinase [Candidatus Moeniiplasma glomeromycotorum]